MISILLYTIIREEFTPAPLILFLHCHPWKCGYHVYGRASWPAECAFVSRARLIASINWRNASLHLLDSGWYKLKTHCTLLLTCFWYKPFKKKEKRLKKKWKRMKKRVALLKWTFATTSENWCQFDILIGLFFFGALLQWQTDWIIFSDLCLKVGLLNFCANEIVLDLL